ncbi:AfsR/SARP family transcriptional regulator [Ornithinimicrobium cerasi]|uniref:DNA-binding transcriptional activator of the SARP family n=1 Tax=Ornithinimicrobium cerasi TaxID=2248773 RepID=A0A285VFR7_9MICO|nr:BTAD domain-containing putative transcriptional regulator [Ornithinimicrobium cerasi]SOC51976.1 DNA-binding transcriptional activator of the SARP family [Ornithinimicrobium cerasi]
MSSLARVRLFGPTTVLLPDRAPVHVLGKHARILALLALQPGRAVSKDRLAELVWEGRPPRSFQQTLDSDVCVLRRRAELGPGRSSALATTPAGYVLDPDRVSVDLQEARALATRAAAEPACTAVASASAALELATGELLEDEPYAPWAEEARAAWRQTEFELCLRASRTALVTGDLATGVDAAQRAVGLRPASEEASVQLMRAQWWAGRRAEAIRGFVQLQDSMLEELGERPGAEARELYITILRDDGPAGDDPADAEHLRLLLQLLRGALDLTPGLRAPALDAELAAAASAALTRLGTAGSPSGARR